MENTTKEDTKMEDAMKLNHKQHARIAALETAKRVMALQSENAKDLLNYADKVYEWLVKDL